MSFQQYNGFGGQARRESDRVVIYLSPQQQVPKSVPYELQEHIPPDDWDMRLTTIRDIAFKFYKPLFERIWFAAGFITSIILPLAIYRVLANSLDVDDKSATLREREQRFFEARSISMGVLVGCLVFFWVPLAVWKLIGRRRVLVQIGRWARADVDRAARGVATFVPVWTVKAPDVFRSTCTVSISTPPNARPTVFHPAAYLPPYINPPADGGVPYYYPYAPGQPGIPRMSVVGGLPAYSSVAPHSKDRYLDDIKE